MKINKRILIPVISFAVIAILATSFGLIFGLDNGCKEHVAGEWIIDQEATCTEAGSRHTECTVCGVTIETVTIEALGHDIIHNLSKTPSCTEIGWDSYETCQREGCQYNTYEEISALGHEWASEWTTDESGHWHICTHDGCKVKSNDENHSVAGNSHVCEICDYIISYCADDNHDHNCDICGKTLSTCADNDNNHKCDICGSTLTECKDEDNDHNCDICGDILSVCKDDNHDHKCDICNGQFNDHTYSVIEGYSWNDDYSQCKVVVSCSYCSTTTADHKIEIYADVDHSVTQNQSCTLPELTTYTATFDLSSYSNVTAKVVTQTKDVETKEASCIDSDNDHYCDNCNKKISECSYENGICKICGDYDTSGTEGLNYEYDSTTESYSVTQYSGESATVRVPYYYDDGENCSHIVSSIVSGAFAGNASITDVTVADSVTSIGEAAFYQCSGLKNVTLGSGVTSIGQVAFFYCSALESISLGSNLTTIGGQAFMYCSSLSSVVIPDTVTTIEGLAFMSCTSLSSIIIPDTVTSIGENVFMQCSNIKSATIGAGLTSIPSTLFGFCEKLESVTFNCNPTTIGSSAFVNCTSLESIDIPDNVTTIESEAFKNCTKLANISGIDGVTSVGDYAFDNTAWVNNQTGVVYIGTIAYTYKGTDTTMIIKEGTTSIMRYAFQNCTTITSVVIPTSMKYIGQYAFDGCSNLTDVYVSDISAWCGINFESYTGNPLYRDNNLYLNGTLISGDITISGVEAIGCYALTNCTGLTSITIGKDVKTIGYDALYNCTSLTTIYYEGTQAEWNDVVKGTGWYLKSGLTTIVCSDGTIDLS